MLNAKSITERVDWSVATLDRRADYIRSQAEAAIEGGISEARRRQADKTGSTRNDGEGPQTEGAVPEGSGRVLGETPTGAGVQGRVGYNQSAYHGTGALFERFRHTIQ